MALLVVVAQVVSAATKELGNGFHHHGVATPVSNHRGTVANVDGSGRNVVLVWLFDHRGGYALLMIDAATYAITMLAESPVPIGPGGDVLNGRIYFASKSHVYSWEIARTR